MTKCSCSCERQNSRPCHSTQYQREPCLAPSRTEVLTFVEKRPSGIFEGCGWGDLLTSLIMHAPCGELHLLMQRKVLRPPVVREILLPPHLISTQDALLLFTTTLHFSSEQRKLMKEQNGLCKTWCGTGYGDHDIICLLFPRSLVLSGGGLAMW